MESTVTKIITPHTDFKSVTPQIIFASKFRFFVLIYILHKQWVYNCF